MEDESASSSTAWSNNSSVYSIPNSEPDHLTEEPGLIDWISERMDEEFDGQAISVPSGVGFCMAIPSRVIQDVGLMDPVFGRGYSEEIDWCLRSHTMGYKSVLAPSCFVYHAGSGITKAEGIIGDGDRTVERPPSDHRSEVPALHLSAHRSTRLEHHRRHARTRAAADHHLGRPREGLPAGDESAQSDTPGTATWCAFASIPMERAHDHRRLRGIRSSVCRWRGRHLADRRSRLSDSRHARSESSTAGARRRSSKPRPTARAPRPCSDRAPYRERVF